MKTPKAIALIIVLAVFFILISLWTEGTRGIKPITIFDGLYSSSPSQVRESYDQNRAPTYYYTPPSQQNIQPQQNYYYQQYQQPQYQPQYTPQNQFGNPPPFPQY